MLKDKIMDEINKGSKKPVEQPKKEEIRISPYHDLIKAEEYLNKIALKKSPKAKTKDG